MLEAAKAHVDRMVLEAFIEGIEQCDDDYVTAMLVKVCDLYALATIESNRAWYLEHEALRPAPQQGDHAPPSTTCAAS